MEKTRQMKRQSRSKKKKKKSIEGSRRGSLYSGFKTTGFFLAGEILVAENEPLNFCPFVTSSKFFNFYFEKVYGDVLEIQPFFFYFLPFFFIPAGSFAIYGNFNNFTLRLIGELFLYSIRLHFTEDFMKLHCQKRNEDSLTS